MGIHILTYRLSLVNTRKLSRTGVHSIQQFFYSPLPLTLSLSSLRILFFSFSLILAHRKPRSSLSAHVPITRKVSLITKYNYFCKRFASSLGPIRHSTSSRWLLGFLKARLEFKWKVVAECSGHYHTPGWHADNDIRRMNRKKKKKRELKTKVFLWWMWYILMYRGSNWFFFLKVIYTAVHM